MPVIPILISVAAAFVIIQADDALEALNPFGPSGDGFSVGRAAVLGLAATGAFFLFQKLR